MKCPICQSTDTAAFRKVQGNVNIPEDRDIYELQRCRDCEHIFRTNLLDKDIYTDDYYAYNASENQLIKFIEPIFRGQYKLHNKILWDIIQNYSRYQNTPFMRSGRVLDFGGGDGFVLDLYKKLNNETYNVEILDWVAEVSEKKGHKTYKDIHEITETGFDLIRMNHVLEHLKDPVMVVNECYALLRPEGVLVVGIPNIRSLAYSLLKENYDQLSFPDHIHFFSPQSINIIFKDFSKTKIHYPMHKYGLVTNFYHVLTNRHKVPNNAMLEATATLLNIPANLVSKFTKQTHLVDIGCIK